MLGRSARSAVFTTGRRTRARALLAAALLGVTLVAVAGCAREEPRGLAPAEIREYRGRPLDSVDDFRENSIKGPQKVDIDSYRLKVTGEVDSPLELTYDDIIERERVKKVVELFCVEGWSAKVLWEGVLLSDILEQAAYDRDATIVIFRCEDGYSTSLPLDFVVDEDIVLAYKMNDVVLPEERGYPFQVVAEDKWGYKWAKWVTEIEVSSDRDFRGYWEQRGYDDEADLPGR